MWLIQTLFNSSVNFVLFYILQGNGMAFVYYGIPIFSLVDSKEIDGVLKVSILFTRSQLALF